jgi:hypothetical protein
MPPSESEILAARLARMSTLIDALQQACAESEEDRELFLKLKQEIAAARFTLTNVRRVESDSV